MREWRGNPPFPLYAVMIENPVHGERANEYVQSGGMIRENVV